MAAEARLAQSRAAAQSGVQQLRASARAQATRPAVLLGAAAIGLLIGMLLAGRRAPGAARLLAAPTLALGRIGKALLISVGTRSLARLLLHRRPPGRGNGGAMHSSTTRH
jgi:hypothetical protein